MYVCIKEKQMPRRRSTEHLNKGDIQGDRMILFLKITQR
jgi:hypothetical protein